MEAAMNLNVGAPTDIDGEGFASFKQHNGDIITTLQIRGRHWDFRILGRIHTHQRQVVDYFMTCNCLRQLQTLAASREG